MTLAVVLTNSVMRPTLLNGYAIMMQATRTEHCVIEQSSIPVEQLLRDLRHLCAIPATVGQRDELAWAAQRVAALMRQRGLHVDMLPTSGAPTIVGRLAGNSPITLLLYHHYDVAPPGPWRAWHHDPFQLAERDDALYGRGVADGKGPLIAHLNALHALIKGTGTLPCNVMVVAEGEGLSGSPNLPAVVRELQQSTHIDVCLASGGERDADGKPICYGGAKGTLHLRLTVVGANQPLAPGLGVSVPNPLWRLIWALSQIKNQQEEVLINGFYDSIEGPNREDNRLLRAIHLDEAGRLSAWGLNEFLFGTSGVGLVRAEATLPTCNISSLVVEPSSEHTLIPVAATALLDFQLVPRQQPQTIVEQLRVHLAEKDLRDVVVERLPGGYAAAATPLGHAFMQRLNKASGRVYGEPVRCLPLGPFAQPLHVFAEAFHAATATIGCMRPDSAINGPNEHVLLNDLVRHGQILTELLLLLGNQSSDDRKVTEVANG